MQPSLFILAAIGLAARALAQDVVVCGRNEYTHDQVQDAAEAACEHVEEGTSVGRNSYPHRFNNREGFEFDGVTGQFYNFPIMRNGRVYNGGSPGPDRVIITRDCQLAGQITHTGARGNGFVDCTDPISVNTQRNGTSDDDNAGHVASTPAFLIPIVAGAVMAGALV